MRAKLQSGLFVHFLIVNTSLYSNISTGNTCVAFLSAQMGNFFFFNFLLRLLVFLYFNCVINKRASREVIRKERESDIYILCTYSNRA